MNIPRPFAERSFGVPRRWSNLVLRELGPHFGGEILNVSGWDDRDKEGSRYRDYFPQATGYYISNYRGERGTGDAADKTNFEIDLEQPLPAEVRDRFDVVFNHTTLEHVFDVVGAFRALCSMSRDVVMVIVPFAQRMHYTSSYGDYWRFTPQAMRRLFESNGMGVVYEAANNDWNAGLYVFAIGSRQPERWRGVLPSYTPVDSLGGWIGKNPLRRVVHGVARARRTLRI